MKGEMKMKFTVIKDLMKKYSENSAIQDGTSDIVTEQSAFDICKSIPIYDEDGSFTLIAARPGMGKTTFMLQSAVSVALHKQKPVYIISLEHSAESLLRILLKTVDEPFENTIKNLPIHICEDAPLSIDEIEKAIDAEIKDGIVFIDYLELIVTNEKNPIIRNSIVSSGLNALSRHKPIPIICCCQLSRYIEKSMRKDDRPELRDLRYSGSLSQDADIVLFPYRDYYYNTDIPANDTSAECIIAKNRYGEIGTVKLNWNSEKCCFE